MIRPDVVRCTQNIFELEKAALLLNLFHVKYWLKYHDDSIQCPPAPAKKPGELPLLPCTTKNIIRSVALSIGKLSASLSLTFTKLLVLISSSLLEKSLQLIVTTPVGLTSSKSRLE